MTSVDRLEVQSFFERLYGDALHTGSRLVLWSSRDKRSEWTSCISEAASLAEAKGAASDLYFGVCTQDHDRAQKERGRRTGQDGMSFARGYSSTTSAMPGLWLDLDVAGDGHEKRGLPASKRDAWKIIKALPFPPSLAVGTGGGFHIYWLFHEPWEFESDDERHRAAACVRGWQSLATDAGNQLGFSVDATHDLSRVLRPAGTINHKYGCTVALVPVTGSSVDGPRYNPSDFEDWASAVVPVGGAMPEKIERLGELGPDVHPPSEKLTAMLSLAPQFAATWKRERKEFPSQSEYDLSLASMASRAGWKDEEVVALIVAHRRDGGESLKLDRPDYYARLLGKAKAGNNSDEAHERINDRVEAVNQGDSTPDDERGGFLRDLSNLLGFPIRRVLKYMADPPQYRLVLDEGTIHLGGVETILSSNKFRASIAAVSGRLIQRFSGQRWDPVAQAILQAVEELDLGADSSAEGLVSEWLGEYLSTHRPSPDRADAIVARVPFIAHDGIAAFFLSEFRSWLSFHRDERMGRRQVATLLRSAGCAPRTVYQGKDSGGKATTVHVWTVSPAISSTLPYKEESSRVSAPTDSSVNG